MKKFAILVLCSLFAAEAQADCFGFRGMDIKVCLEGDDNAARSKAVEVCEEVSGESCSISGTSGECRESGDKKCYDEEGEEQKHIRVD
jgi:hypothetical protein